MQIIFQNATYQTADLLTHDVLTVFTLSCTNCTWLYHASLQERTSAFPTSPCQHMNSLAVKLVILQENSTDARDQVWRVKTGRVNCCSLSPQLLISPLSLSTSLLMRLPTEGGMVVVLGGRRGVVVKKTQRSLGCLSALYHLTPTGWRIRLCCGRELSQEKQDMFLLIIVTCGMFSLCTSNSAEPQNVIKAKWRMEATWFQNTDLFNWGKNLIFHSDVCCF